MIKASSPVEKSGSSEERFRAVNRGDGRRRERSNHLAVLISYFSLSFDQLMAPFAGIAGVAAVREAEAPFFENIESIARSLGVTLRKVPWRVR